MNEQAVRAFIDKRIEALKLLKAIAENLDDHIGTDPEHVDWTHVGDVAGVVEILREAAQFMGVE